MRAAKTSTGFWHWVHGDRLHSLCGRALTSMRVEREIEFDHLPPDGQICVPCEAARQSGDYTDRDVVLPPSRGYVRKTGPLYHGTTSRHSATRIWAGDE